MPDPYPHIDERRYVYIGRDIAEDWTVHPQERVCDAVLRPDGCVIRGKNRNQLIRWSDTKEYTIVNGRALRLRKKYYANQETAND